MPQPTDARTRLIETTKELLASEEFPSKRQLAIAVAKRLGIAGKTAYSQICSKKLVTAKWGSGKPIFTVNETPPEKVAKPEAHPEGPVRSTKPVKPPSPPSSKEVSTMTDAELKKVRDEIVAQLKTCSGEQCELLRKQAAEVSTVVKAAVDSRMDAYAKRMEALEAKLGAPAPVAPTPVAANPNPDIPEDYDFFRCTCGKILNPGIPNCPKCNAELDWGNIMAGYATQFLLASPPAVKTPEAK